MVHFKILWLFLVLFPVIFILVYSSNKPTLTGFHIVKVDEKKFIKKAAKEIVDAYSDSTREKNRTKRLPDIICIGTEKCGSGALLHFLGEHPLIRTRERYESHFFDLSYERGLDFYLETLPDAADNEYIMEKTPAYFHHPLADVPQLIHKDIPNAKILLIVCDPVNRTLSDYVQEQRLGNIPKDMRYEVVMDQLLMNFNERSVFPILNDHSAMEYILAKHRNNFLTHLLSTGLYYFHLKRWLKYYNETNLMIINGEQLITNPGDVIEKTQDFLHIPKLLTKDQFILNKNSGFYCVKSRDPREKDFNHCLSTLNKGRTRLKHISVSISTTNKLRKFYDPYNNKLFNLIHTKYDWQ